MGAGVIKSAGSGGRRRRHRGRAAAMSEINVTPFVDVMLVLMITVIFAGFPISFTILFLALVFGYIGLGASVFDLAYFQTIGMMKEELLAAIPMVWK